MHQSAPHLLNWTELLHKLRFPLIFCRLSKYHSQKPESTRRKIFNRDSTLQYFVQISSGSVNSSVRARAKTYGSTPVSIELPRGRHLGSKCLHLLGPDACIIGAPMPSSTLHERAQQEASDAHSFMCKSTIQDARVATSYARPRIPASPRHARVQGIPASASLRASKMMLTSATSYARLPMARVQRCPRWPCHPRT